MVNVTKSVTGRSFNAVAFTKTLFLSKTSRSRCANLRCQGIEKSLSKFTLMEGRSEGENPSLSDSSSFPAASRPLPRTMPTVLRLLAPPRTLPLSTSSPAASADLSVMSFGRFLTLSALLLVHFCCTDGILRRRRRRRRRRVNSRMRGSSYAE